MSLTASELPSGEYASFYGTYIRAVPGQQTLAQALSASQQRLDTWLDQLPPAGFDYAYAPGKWSVAEVIRHLADSERVFAYRALWFARGAADPLPGFDQETFAKAAGTPRDVAALRAELRGLRRTTENFFASLSPAALERSGQASGTGVSVRALGFITAGHSYHHVRLFGERYAGALA